MKKIEAIIRSSTFKEVKEALKNIGVHFFTFYEVKGFGLQQGKNISHRGALYDVGYIARMKLEIVLPDNAVELAMDAIRIFGHTGEKGDGLVFVTKIDEIVNIRTRLKNGESIL